MNVPREYETLVVRFQEPICFIRFDRPEANNTINGILLHELAEVLDLCETTATIVVLEGSDKYFCFGADFAGMKNAVLKQQSEGSVADSNDPELLYQVWQQLQQGPYISLAHVRGKANAGGIGFVAACDIVISDESAVFSLSELLFGLMPACVMPFLIRRMGFQKAHYLTLMTQPVSAQQALAWGLVDIVDRDSKTALRKHLLRLRRLRGTAIVRYKQYVNALSKPSVDEKQMALIANREVFSDPQTIDAIVRYVSDGTFPWEQS